LLHQLVASNAPARGCSCCWAGRTEWDMDGGGGKVEIAAFTDNDPLILHNYPFMYVSVK